MQKNTDFYRADIDGLRAIAIVAVVLYHMMPSQFSGGYVGVDIFFVISGYLISSILFRQMDQNKFSLSDFYIKRIIRLFPSLLIVLIATLAFGWFTMLRHEFIELGKHVAGGAGFIANIILFKETGYFNKASELKPLLHLWSLGVEEQFYFIWPLAIFLIWKMSPRFLLPFLIGSIGYSFGVNLNKFQQSPDYAFFLPQARFWEIFVGAFISLCFYKGWVNIQRKLRSAISILGILFCLLSFYMITETTKFPGYWALLPVIGTSFLIVAGPDAFINRTVLSKPLLVFIGLISYPLYLWHWPLLSYAHIIHAGSPPLTLMVSLVLASFVIAIPTYLYIERPFKFFSFETKKTASAYLLGGLFFMGLVGYIVFMNLISPLSSQKGLDPISQASDDWDFPGRLEMIQKKGSYPYFVQGKNVEKVIYVGDSNIQQYYPRMEEILKKKPDSLGVVIYTGGKCPPIPKIQHDGKYKFCSERIEGGFKEALSNEAVKNVVIGAQWTSYFTDKTEFYIVEDGVKNFILDHPAKAFTELGKVIVDLRSKGKKVFVVMNIPVGANFNPMSNLKRGIFNNGIRYVETPITRAEFENKFSKTFMSLKQTARLSGAILIDPMDQICGQEYDRCTISLNGKPIYKDPSHLRPFYVRDYATFIDQTMDSAP